MQHFIDPTTPRYQLPLDQLPRGFVPFPQRVREGLEMVQLRQGRRFSEEYARNSLVAQTLIYYYDGLPVAYRPAERGVEVLAVGWEETKRYWAVQEDGVKVVQP
jgi:hypothetical protein